VWGGGGGLKEGGGQPPVGGGGGGGGLPHPLVYSHTQTDTLFYGIAMGVYSL